MNSNLNICNKTVMDSTDPNIVFDDNGISDYYHNYINKILPTWQMGQQGFDELNKIAEKMAPMKEGIRNTNKTPKESTIPFLLRYCFLELK